LNKTLGLENLLDEYSACCDNPACGFVFELAEMNPNAKIILTVRDSAEAWEKSATDTIFRIIYDSRFTPGLLNSMINWVPILGRLTGLKRLGVATMDKCSVQGKIFMVEHIGGSFLDNKSRICSSSRIHGWLISIFKVFILI